MDRTEALSHVLKRIREDKELTQLVVAGLAKMSAASVGNIETHRKGLRISTFFDLCDALGVRASDVLRQAEDEAAQHRGRSRPQKARTGRPPSKKPAP
ncbi:MULTISPECIES: helix-turn-helix domain-containing protein [Cupriavidus]|jgi:transcriptional regulator with XRE-family HTH domain|uniref:Helix-turn-helix domain-containing protein n=1 Tax=Cupriavidus campinensis TaxID=151783 RepID=A0AAE9I563_9BURK|nr:MULTISPECIES: helix-turn-helix transcriptional regulator [Cupriavidus]MCM3606184.1 helix-turn-helix domain-containing protein [Cupriavidus pauculus]MDT6961266.1 helix-turn-helix transcriptional regulator [Cupriavidus sp. SZY C1]MWL89989.1 helix-turn-helix domain-containing protein [Cupriavidus sp. SW-Y-13]QWE96800.1 helix-turn-helix domain-containing protein [Cupriavidus sp. EM10]TSP12055.1 helix-turn-helix transcriptional regulator [Cupriavidus campinensis]